MKVSRAAASIFREHGDHRLKILDALLDFWLNSLAGGTPRPDIVVGISESEEHKDIRAGVIDNGVQFFDQPLL